MKAIPCGEMLLAEYSRSFAAEFVLHLSINITSPLFRLLCQALLTSAPVQADIAMCSARAIAEAT